MENQLEQGLIKQLTELKYAHRPDIVDRKTLEQNFRTKFEALNRVRLTENEFLRLREEIIRPDVFAASRFLRERQYFQREDGTPLHYTLVNNREWCKNDFEVVSQLKINTENSHQRYDVIILINGLPLVQIELKRGGISARKAMQQIVDYKQDPGNGYGNSLLCFMQLFIVSNGTHTRYFANNKAQHFAFDADEQFLPVYQLADAGNRKINLLHEFADAFLKKCSLGEMIGKYMVLLESEQKLLVMRPYQIFAVKAIMDCIRENRGNGYIWHTTGSGKTLTSFKAATLMKERPDIEKCLFVVDRKDLDRQTREEFNKFQPGSVEENTNTETLVRRLLSTDYSDKVIVTTIQKLGLALQGNNKRNYKERLQALSQKRLVFIFDECHRSQFGDNHQAITEFFPNAQLFGFTGTPIFDDNATYPVREGEYATYKTTESLFEKSLHEYTITNAIDDENVLRFHIDYYKGEDGATRPGVPLARQAVVDAILKKHDEATAHRRFNALLATASINDAIEYYRCFKERQQQKQAEDPLFVPLQVACVFSPPAQPPKDADAAQQRNAADIRQLQDELAQEEFDNRTDPDGKRAALAEIIADYNRQYGTNHSVNEFDLYYQDVQQRIKDQKWSHADYPRKNKIDLTIVVDMLLTGFDAKYLNTLYVDKNLKYHGLVQAFSRTNRVLNSTKPYGHILDFRAQQKAVNEAIELFSGMSKGRAKEIWLVEPAPVVIEKYKEAVAALGAFMSAQNLAEEPEEVYNLKGDAARIQFLKNFKDIQKLRNELDQYTDLSDEERQQVEAILPEAKFLEFRTNYIETAKRYQERERKDPGSVPEGARQLDFEFVLFASALIDYDYILGLVADSTQKTPKKQQMSKEQVKALIRSNSNLMHEEEDLTAYIDSLDWNKGIEVAELRSGFEAFKRAKNEEALADMARKHGLEPERLKAFVDAVLDRMIFDGEQLTELLAPLGLSWKERRLRELALMQDLAPQLNKIAGGREISGLKAYE